MEALEWTIFNIRLIISSMWTTFVYFRQIRFSIRCHETIIVIFNEHLIKKSNKIFFFANNLYWMQNLEIVLTWYMYFYFNIQNVKKKLWPEQQRIASCVTRLTLKFWKTIRNAYISIVNIKKREKKYFLTKTVTMLLNKGVLRSEDLFSNWRDLHFIKILWYCMKCNELLVYK